MFNMMITTLFFLMMMINSNTLMLPTLFKLIIYSLFTGILIMLMNLPWMGLVVMMIYLGGVLIMFSYTCSLSTNNKVMVNLNYVKLKLLAAAGMMFLLVFSNHQIWQNFYSLSYLNISYFFYFKWMSSLVLVTGVILLYMLMCMSIVEFFMGPLMLKHRG